MTDLTTRVTVPESVLFRDLDGEAVLLETATGRYYGLNEVGTRMWSLLQLHGEIEAVCRALLTEYDVPEEPAARGSPAASSTPSPRAVLGSGQTDERPLRRC